MQPLNNDKNWKDWPIPLSRVCHTLVCTHPDQWAHSIFASVSQVKHPTSVRSPAFTWIHKTQVAEMKRIQVASWREACMQAAVKLMEISLCSHWHTTLLSPPRSFSPSSLTPPSFVCPPLLLQTLPPSPPDPAPAVHLFIPCDITQSNNVSLFAVGTLCSLYVARNQEERRDNGAIVITAVANMSCDCSSEWPLSQGAICDAVLHLLQHWKIKPIFNKKSCKSCISITWKQGECGHRKH